MRHPMSLPILGIILLLAGTFILAIGGCTDARTQDTGSNLSTIDEYAKTIIDHPDRAVELATEIRRLAGAAGVANGTALPTTAPAAPTPAPTPGATK